MQELSHDEMYGIAKKISREFSEYPLHTHGALIQMVNIGFEHRKLAMQRAEKEAHDAAQERALKMQEQQIGLAMAEQRRAEDAKARPGLAIVTQ